MWDEEINKKIKDAADQYHPAYDDAAWGKMEQLLDEHLPQKKDRRRIIYFIPLAIIVAGLGLFMVFRKDAGSGSKVSGKIASKSNSENSRVSGTIPAKAIVDPNASAQPAPLVATETGNKNNVLKDLPVNTSNSNTKNTPGFSKHSSINPGKRGVRLISGNTTPGATEEKDESKYVPVALNEQKDPAKEKESTSNTPTEPEQNQPDSKIPSPGKTGSASATNVNNSIPKDNGDITAKKEPGKIKDVAGIEKPKVTKAGNNQNNSKSFIQNFGIGLSLGPDASAVKLRNAGKVTLTYGAQLSYSLSNKFTIRTGFYVAKKLYSADENQYHVPQGGAWNRYLSSIDADCKVYEIPLTLSYTFSRSKNHSWFASTGLSSYFMKRESYVYNYKNDPVMGNYSNPPWVITNQNKHYFSVLDISGGYEYSFNKRFSLAAEPYVKIPLSGIGAGKIKLNSTGALFTISVKPFLK